MPETEPAPEYKTKLEFNDYELELLRRAVENHCHMVDNYQEMMDQEKYTKLWELYSKLHETYVRSMKEKEVLKLRLEGKTYAEIAREVFRDEIGRLDVKEIIERRLGD